VYERWVPVSLLSLAAVCSLACGPSQTIDIQYREFTNPRRTIMVTAQSYCDMADGLLVRVQDEQKTPWWRGGIGSEGVAVDLFAKADCRGEPDTRRALEAGACTWRAFVVTRSLGRVWEFSIPQPTVHARFVPAGLMFELSGGPTEATRDGVVVASTSENIPSTIRTGLTVIEEKGLVERLCSWMGIPTGVSDFLGCSKT